MEELNLRTYDAVRQFLSVRRAIQRGHVSDDGIIYPKRPFNNRKRGKGRKHQVLKMEIYEQLTRRDNPSIFDEEGDNPQFIGDKN